MSDVSVIGLGAMGSALAVALIKGGYAVTVWNRSPEKAAPLVAAGAVQAGSAAEALRASPVTVICIASHDKTLELLGTTGDAVSGRTIIELSTGGAEDAEALAAHLEGQGADWMIGIINAYPTGVGLPETVLLLVGAEPVWQRFKPLIRTLGGGSARVGDAAGMIAALFAALFTTRQGFMFGMIYGGLVCRKAGIPLDVFASQIPVSMGVLPAYHKYFSDTVPAGRFDNPPATMTVYAAALDDALATFRALGARAELPQLFSELAHRGVEAGLDDKALTALVELMSRD